MPIALRYAIVEIDTTVFHWLSIVPAFCFYEETEKMPFDKEQVFAYVTYCGRWDPSFKEGENIATGTYF